MVGTEGVGAPCSFSCLRYECSPEVVIALSSDAISGRRSFCVAVTQKHWPSPLHEARTAIYRKFPCGNFVQAVDLIRQIADLAEDEQHHPDLHLTGYRNLRVELTTHAIGGLSENDFIVAAKIDQRVP